MQTENRRGPAPASQRPEIEAFLSRVRALGPRTEQGRRESEQMKVQALVFVGDAMEEGIDDLCAAAGELGLLGIPAFMFQEGQEPVAEQAFRGIARLTHGAYCRFDPGAAGELAELLRAAAAYAAGGLQALTDASRRSGAATAKLLQQLR
jgi:hypothetical protein